MPLPMGWQGLVWPLLMLISPPIVAIEHVEGRGGDRGGSEKERKKKKFIKK